MSGRVAGDPRLWGWLAPEEPDLFAESPGIEAWVAQRLGLAGLTAAPPAPFAPDAAPASRLPEAARAALAERLGSDGLTLDPLVRAQRSIGQSYPDQIARRGGALPRLCDAVAFPADAEAVQAVLDLAAAHGLQVTPVAGGTNVVGAIAARDPDRPWIVLDLARLDAVVEINRTDLTARVQAGISLPALEARLAADGLTLGHFPQSFQRAALGGAIAANGAGQASDGYGRMSELLVSATLATPRGRWSTEAFRHGGAGPWLGGLVTGSEGLFGVIVEAVVRVRPKPEIADDRAWALPSFAAGVEAMRILAQQGHGLSMLRLSDPDEAGFYADLRLRRKGLDRPPLAERIVARLARVPPRPALLVASFEGEKAQMTGAFAAAGRVLARAGAVSLGARPGRSWRRDRYLAPNWRESLLARGLGVETFETAAPWSRLGHLHVAVADAIAAAIVETGPAGVHPLVFAHVSHSYPEGASVYFTAIFPMAADPIAQWRILKARALDMIVASGGTLSHHHGMGADHVRLAAAEKSDLGLDALRAVAGAFDPGAVLATGAAAALRD